MKTVTQIYDEYIKLASSDMQGAKESMGAMTEYILGSTARYHGRCVKSLYVPKIFTTEETALFNRLVKELYVIFNKVIDEYMSNPEYRKLFDFDERLQELILQEPLYDSKIPIARIDIFLDERTHDFKFCEFNTDGTSAMNEDRELTKAVQKTKAFQEFSERYDMETFELFDSWVSAATHIYEDYCAKKGFKASAGHVVITDFMENATENEFVIFKEAFEHAGYTAEICEIRDLVYHDNALYSASGKKIDIIYRRAVTSDIMAHYEQIGDFINAVKDGVVCLLGEIRTQIVHNKLLFKVLHDDMTLKLLSNDEKEFINAHVPYTVVLDDASLNREYRGQRLIDAVFANRTGWIIKPEDSYGSKGVHAGVECNNEEWEEFIRNNTNKGYILQEFIHPYTTANIDFSKDDEWHEYSNLTGLFVYDGQFSGVYSRISACEMISTQYSEMALPTFVVKQIEE